MIMIEALGTSTPTSMTVVETRIESAPEANAAITRSFSLPASLPCTRPTRVAEALGELGVALLRRGEVELLKLFDQRADPIDLRARGDGAPDPGDHLLQPLERHVGASRPASAPAASRRGARRPCRHSS